MRNLEIKARVDDLKRLRNIAANLGAVPGGKDRQIDTYYKTMDGRLKVRESSITGNELIAYFRPDATGPVECEYERTRLHDVSRFKRVLGRALDTLGVVVKDREIFMLGNSRIHLDEVENMGCFIELELELDDDAQNRIPDPATIIEDTIRIFGIKEENIVGCSYIDLIEPGMKNKR